MSGDRHDLTADGQTLVSRQPLPPVLCRKLVLSYAGSQRGFRSELDHDDARPGCFYSHSILFLSTDYELTNRN